jgi:UDP-N-acetylmuramate--alanine ligase
MIAHILRHSGYGCNAFLGGIAVNYNSNFWSDKRNVCVVEADEYDRSFLKLSPNVAVITAMDADHLDIYGTAEEVEKAFIDFSGRLKEGGLLLRKEGLKRGDELKGDVRRTYSLEAPPTSGEDVADVSAFDIILDEGSYTFGVRTQDWSLENIVLNMGGLHNVENITAAIGVAHHLGIEDEKIRAAVEAFRGVKRRFEYIVKTPEVVYIDDYAHHPEELRALISGAKGLFGDKKCTVLFQPHLFTRTRDFSDGFAESLELADEVFLLPIYPARELPIAGVTSEMIASKMTGGKARVCDKEELLRILKDKAAHKGELELVITAGAGDIDTLVTPVKELLEAAKRR